MTNSGQLCVRIVTGQPPLQLDHYSPEWYVTTQSSNALSTRCLAVLCSVSPLKAVPHVETSRHTDSQLPCCEQHPTCLPSVLHNSVKFVLEGCYNGSVMMSQPTACIFTDDLRQTATNMRCPVSASSATEEGPQSQPRQTPRLPVSPANHPKVTGSQCCGRT